MSDTLQAGWWSVPAAFEVGLYHKDTTHGHAYHQRFIKNEDTAKACAKQWTEELRSGSEVKIVPLFKEPQPGTFTPLYQVRAGNDCWLDVSHDEYTVSLPKARRIVWHRM